MAGTDEELVEQIRDRYAAVAQKIVTTGQPAGCRSGPEPETDSCCGRAASPAIQIADVGEGFGARLYTDAERGGLPEEAVLASLGCGNPIAMAELRDGETVLDLGSGGGIDVLLSARRVGPSGKAYGLDMTDEMLQLARANAAKSGASNVEFLKGRIEAIPLPDASIDVVISNCVVNLSPDKAAVLAETARVLKPGGRIGITDVVAEDHLTAEDRAVRGNHVGCIAGALSFSEYIEGLTDAGLRQISVTPTHAVANGMYSAIIRAVKAIAQPDQAAPLAEQRIVNGSGNEPNQQAC